MEASRETAKKIVPVIEVDEQRLRSHVAEVVLKSVEETLNGLLDAEADALCQASRYERSARASMSASRMSATVRPPAQVVAVKGSVRHGSRGGPEPGCRHRVCDRGESNPA